MIPKLVTLLGCLTISLQSLTSMAAETKKSVFVETAKPQEIFDNFSYPAKVVPSVNSTIIAETQGVVEKIRFPLGTKVKPRDELAVIRHTDPIYNYRPMGLKAPVSGIVSMVFVNEGTFVSKGDKILMITDPSQAKVIIEVPAKDLGFLKQGLDGELVVKGYEKDFKVQIAGISPFVDPASGTASVELKITYHQNDSLPLGSLGKVNFKSNIHQGFVLPQDALNYLGTKTFVHVVDQAQKVKKVPVSVGSKRRGQVEILDGVKAGDQVVVRSSAFLDEGTEVEIKQEEAANKTQAEQKNI